MKCTFLLLARSIQLPLRRRRPVEGRKNVAHGEAEGPERSRTGRRQAVGNRYS